MIQPSGGGRYDLDERGRRKPHGHSGPDPSTQPVSPWKPEAHVQLWAQTAGRELYCSSASVVQVS